MSPRSKGGLILCVAFEAAAQGRHAHPQVYTHQGAESLTRQVPAWTPCPAVPQTRPTTLPPRRSLSCSWARTVPSMAETDQAWAHAGFQSRVLTTQGAGAACPARRHPLTRAPQPGDAPTRRDRKVRARPQDQQGTSCIVYMFTAFRAAQDLTEMPDLSQGQTQQNMTGLSSAVTP